MAEGRHDGARASRTGAARRLRRTRRGARQRGEWGFPLMRPSIFPSIFRSIFSSELPPRVAALSQVTRPLVGV